MILISMAWPPLIYADADMLLGLIWRFAVPSLRAPYARHEQGVSNKCDTKKSLILVCYSFFFPSLSIAFLSGKSWFCWSASVLSPVFFFMYWLHLAFSAAHLLSMLKSMLSDHTACLRRSKYYCYPWIWVHI